VGEGSYWRVRSFTYNDISCQGYFAKILRETAEITGFYAGFSPVLPDSLGKNLQRVVVRCTPHNYLLCFCSLSRRFAIRHIFTACSMLVHLFAVRKPAVAG
jgi:hypothetical protein